MFPIRIAIGAPPVRAFVHSFQGYGRKLSLEHLTWAVIQDAIPEAYEPYTEFKADASTSSRPRRFALDLSSRKIITPVAHPCLQSGLNLTMQVLVGSPPPPHQIHSTPTHTHTS